MGSSERAKGVRGEREVARLLEDAGLTVRGLESSGDHLCVVRDGVTLHVEVKRQERIQLPIWLRQAQAECEPGNVPVVAFRQNHGDWYAALPLRSLVGLLEAGTHDV